MEAIKAVIKKAMEEKTTLIAEHNCREISKEPLKVEVFPYKLDDDFLICYDIENDQPYIIDLRKVVKIIQTDKMFPSVPKQCWLK